MKSQIKLPLHLATDAQGAIGIMDATGRAVLFGSEVFTPTKGYVWEPPYAERNELIEAVMAFINLRVGIAQRRRKRRGLT